jgi:hypothetical protein
MAHQSGECHIIPFYIRACKSVKMEHSDLSLDRTTIRGLRCVRRRMDSTVRVHKLGRKIENVFYWVPEDRGSCIFERGVELVRNGLGYPKGEAQSVIDLFRKYVGKD